MNDISTQEHNKCNDRTAALSRLNFCLRSCQLNGPRYKFAVLGGRLKYITICSLSVRDDGVGLPGADMAGECTGLIVRLGAKSVMLGVGHAERSARRSLLRLTEDPFMDGVVGLAAF